MIISKNINPTRDLYYLGGLIIELLDSSKSDEYDYFDLYLAIKKTQDISMNLFILSMDWLYILGVIQNNNGMIKKCF